MNRARQLGALLGGLLLGLPGVALAGNRLWIAWDPGTSTCKAEVLDFYNCILTGTNFNQLSLEYPNGESMSVGGSVVLNGACGATDWQCIVNQGGWAVQPYDIVMHYYGSSWVGGTNGTATVSVGGKNVPINTAWVQTGANCNGQTGSGAHELYEAATDGVSADCCNGQTSATSCPNCSLTCSQYGASGNPRYGYYSFQCPNGTYTMELLGRHAQEFVPAGCTYLSNVAAPPQLSQVNGNDAVTLVNWPSDGHAELFAKSLAGDLVHVWTNGDTETWNPAGNLSSGGECGTSSVMWLPPRGPFPELFGPAADGSMQHLWWSGSWNTFSGFGTAGGGLSHPSTLAWPDGHSEVFALGADHAIWHNGWVNNAWAGWQSLGGAVATGASPILWTDGHAELFATDANGTVWHDWSGNFPSGWHGWASMGGNIASRPVPVRWADGHVEVFATGTDGQLYHAWTSSTGWSTFQVLSAGTQIRGEPSAVINSGSNGAAAGAEVFARSDTGAVLHLWWTGSGWTTFSPVLTQTATSDPFAWVRADGHVEVFVVDPQGVLMRLYHASSGWQSWTQTATGLDPCVPTPPAPDAGPLADAGGPPLPDAGDSPDAGARDGGAGQVDGGAVADASTPTLGPKGGCGCGTGTGSSGALGLAWLLLALGWSRRRHRALAD